ncbi:5'-3' exonuclease [Bacillus methanolicus PB1]|uniref:5'-3' exonuclease n=1 Tax=Bacillus methanolicus PB1 TaxID=997296 RepID=I3DWI1_BACMT|nr:5'-3' exonuclease H3TH domain-containing protein [Bacillus methanolicus]EIJ78602.1 5'-3' exonuclease [Bacillus methanolicus PB1]
MKKPLFMMVDGMALLFRSFYATAVAGQFMINSKDIPTNGVYGFIKHFFTAVNKFHPTHVAVCWDMGSKTFRTELFEGYKANRSEPPVELLPQFDLAKEIVEAFNVPNIGLEGFEADDCIGTLAIQSCQDADVLILTGDQDILQLIDENISVALLKKGFGNYHVYTKELFFEEKGIYPQQMIDLKALMGDSSDNYPGVRGIGEKTALKLVQQFQNVEGIVSNLKNLSKAQRTKIEQDLEMMYLSRQLAEIKCDAPVSCSLNDALFQIDRQKVIEKFKELEFRGLHRYLEIEKEYA